MMKKKDAHTQHCVKSNFLSVTAKRLLKIERILISYSIWESGEKYEIEKNK